MMIVEILFVLAVLSIALPFVLLGPALAYRALSRPRAEASAQQLSAAVERATS